MQHVDSAAPASVQPESRSVTSSFDSVDSGLSIDPSTQHISVADEPFVTAKAGEFVVKGSDIELDMSSEELIQAMAEGNIPSFVCNIVLCVGWIVEEFGHTIYICGH